MLGPREMHSSTTAAGHSATDDYFSYGSRSQLPTQRQYKAPGVSDTTLSPTKGSAKRLISQYERMGTPPAGTTTLLRNKSTKSKQYVYDYRAATAPLEPSHLQAPEHGSKSSHPQFGQGGGAGSKKDHSPLRQSLRNLFSVIRKGAGGLTKKKAGDDGVGSVLHRGDSLNGRRHGESQKLKNVSGSKFSAVANIPMGVDPPIPHIGKLQKLTGSIFYLTRTLLLRDLDHQSIPTGGDISTSTDLAWTSCNVTLDPSTRKMQLSSFNQEMQLVLHEISLAGCIDIHSLSVPQLSERVAKLLDETSVKFEGELGRLKVFEVRFDKRPKELFAVRSVKERAGWISAIWNVILPEGVQANSNQPVSTKSMVRNSTQHDKPIKSPRPIPLPEMTTLLSHSCSNRSLPPLPADVLESAPSSDITRVPAPKLKSKKPTNLHLDIPPLNNVLSPSIYPPSSRTSSSAGSQVDPRPPFLLSSNSSTTVIRPTFLSPSTSPATSRPASILSTISPSTNSSSIMNLTQLSMVRQRLAQIERNHSQISSQSTGSNAGTSVLIPEAPAVGNKDATKSNSSLSSQSGRSKRKAEVLPAMTETTESVPTLTAMNRDISFEAGKLLLEGLITSHEDGSSLDENEYARNHLKSMSRDQLTKQDVEDLSLQVKDVKGVLGGESGYPTIHQVVLGLDDKARGTVKALKTIQERINQLEGRLANSTVPSAALDGGAERHESVLHAIEDVKGKLATELPLVMSTVHDLQSKQDRLLELSTERERDVRYSNVASSEGAHKSTDNAIEMKLVLNKLEELRVIFEASRNAIVQKNEGTEQPTTLVEHVEKILALIQEDCERRAVSSQQQADSVRYLNELNNWLEMFVNNGTSQIQGLSSNVEQLCRTFGCSPQSPGTPKQGVGIEDEIRPNLLGDIKQLVEGMQTRDQNFAALQAAVHSLLEVLSSSQAQMGAESQTIATLITRQRQEQEILLRNFIAEISGEIKGERLRFVEAMKEATAINVQLHVEHFKRDLGREVMVMTGEVGRLHREKQIIENQISDLFAFYSKHKQETPPQLGRTKIEAANPTPGLEYPPVNIPRSSHHRPLPHPRLP